MQPTTQQPDRPRVGDSWREWLKVGLPALVLFSIALTITWHFVEPAPPRRVVIAAGPLGGAYHRFALQYAQYFTANGIHLEVRDTGGSVENYQLLADPNSGVDLAIVQSGTAPENREGLEAICGVYYEPVWVFYRAEAFAGTTPTRLTQLAGKRVCVGPVGSGTRPLALTLLADNGIAGGDAGTPLLDLGGTAAIAALRDAQADAAFMVIAPDADAIREAVTTPGVKIMSFEHARAYSRRHSYLWAVTLYEGSLDLARNLPDHDVQLVAPSATLACRSSLHKGILGLLVRAAIQTHSGGTLLSDPGTFPSPDKTQLPVGADARYFLSTKPGFLHRTLPFWIASLIDRMLLLIVPSLVVLLPLLHVMPPIYRWRMRSKIYRWYRQLRELDRRLDLPVSPGEAAKDLAALARLETEVLSVKVPLSYMEESYNLRLHLGYVRSRLEAAAGVAAKE